MNNNRKFKDETENLIHNERISKETLNIRYAKSDTKN